MAQFRIDQTGGAGTGTNNRSRHDLDPGFVLTLVATDPVGVGVTYSWEIVDKVNSAAVLSATTGASVTIGAAGFIVAGSTFLIQLTVDDNGDVTTIRRVASVRTTSAGLRYPMFSEGAPTSHTRSTNSPDASVDNATYDDLAGLGSPAQNWRGWAEWGKEIVDSLEATSLAVAYSSLQKFNSPLDGVSSGTTWANVGALYIQAGTLLAGAAVFAGDALGVGTAEVELVRNTGAVTIASWSVTGVLAEDATLVDIAIPASDWYYIRVRGDAVGVDATVRGIQWVVS